MIHEFEQIVPAPTPKAGLHVAEEGQVLLARVRLREKLLKGLQQWKQYLLLVNWFVTAKETTHARFMFLIFGTIHWDR